MSGSNTRENGPFIAAGSSGVYVPPHLNSNNSFSYLRNGVPGEGRYNKDQLLDIYKTQRDSGSLDRNLAELFQGRWNPLVQKDDVDSGRGKRDDAKDLALGPEICWNQNLEAEPLGLVGMTDEEKEVTQPTFQPKLMRD